MVYAAAGATTIGLLPVFAGFGQDLPTGALFCAGWPALGLAAAVLLDREPGSRIGRTMVALAMLPAALVLAALLLADGQWAWDPLERVGERSAVLLVLVTLVALGWAMGLPADRMSRRRLTWFLLWSCVLMAAVTAVSLLASSQTLAAVTTLGIWALAALVLRLATTSEFRPVEEPVMDAAVPLAALLIGAAAALVVRAAGDRSAGTDTGYSASATSTRRGRQPSPSRRPGSASRRSEDCPPRSPRSVRRATPRAGPSSWGALA